MSADLAGDSPLSGLANFHVKGDSFGEDRQTLQRHHTGAAHSVLRSTAHTLLSASCPLWTDKAPMIARAGWVSIRPTSIRSALKCLSKGHAGPCDGVDR